MSEEKTKALAGLKTPLMIERFLKTLAETGSPTKACQEVNIPRHVVYYWRRTDADFAELWDDAKQIALDDLEYAARERALHGAEYETVNKDGEVVSIRSQPSDAMTKFLLTVHRYKDHGKAETHVHKHQHLHLVSDEQLEAIATSGERKKLSASLGNTSGEDRSDLPVADEQAEPLPEHSLVTSAFLGKR